MTLEESTGSSPDTNTIQLVSSAASKITDVYLYSGRAEITRLFEFGIKGGRNTVNIVGFPPSLQENNVRVVGLGNATIHNVVVGKTEAPQRSHRATTPISRSHKELEDALKSAQHSRASLDTYLTTISTVHLNMSSVEQTLEAYVSLCAKVDKQIFDLEKKLEEATEELRSTGGKTESEEAYIPSWKVSLSMEGKIDETVKLSIIYAVCSADWTPFYDIQIDTQNKEHQVTFIYKAIITQATGESWENVRLTLGTVRPPFGAQHQLPSPTLLPWIVQGYHDQPPIQPMNDTPSRWPEDSIQQALAALIPPGVGMVQLESQPVTYRSERLPTYRSELLPTYHSQRHEPTYQPTRSPARRNSPPLVMSVMPEPVFILVSNKGDIATTFRIPGLLTVPNNQDKHCATIAELIMVAALIRYTIPAMSNTVYFKARFRNDTEYVFVPGLADIHVDGSLVNIINLPSVSPQESFDCPLGYDDSIRITYHPLEKMSIKSGSVAKNKSQSYSRRITVLNTKATPAQDLKVIDRVPISSDERIEIKIVNPALSVPPAGQALAGSSPSQTVPVSQGVFAQWDGADGDSLAGEDRENVGKNGKFNWIVSIPPLSSVRLTLEYDISHPEDLSVRGL